MGISMDVSEARTKARELMNSHGLNDWYLAFGTSHRRLGSTVLRTKTIRLSRPMVEINDWHDVRLVVLHEIAHVLTFQQYGTRVNPHGPEWRRNARKIGASPTHTSHVTNVPKPRYRATCPICGHEYAKSQRPVKYVYTCNARHPGADALVWVDSTTGERVESK